MAFMPTGEIIIHDGNAHQFVNPIVDGEVKRCGTVPRDWGKHPCGSLPGVPAFARPKLPRSDWSALIKAQADRKARLSDVRDTAYGSPIPSRDQNGRGYCWAHSTVSAAILSRAANNLPYADLSAYAIACVIKNFRDEGGWNAESMEFLRTRGCPTSEFWPQRSASRSNDNPKTWENAALYKMLEWEDIPEGDFGAQITCLLNSDPHALDLSWWRHSICAADAVDGVSLFGGMRSESGKLLTLAEFNAIWRPDDFGGAFGIRIWNSWSDSWSANGMGVLTESKATNNGAISLRVMRAAA